MLQAKLMKNHPKGGTQKNALEFLWIIYSFITHLSGHQDKKAIKFPRLANCQLLTLLTDL
jgi:hypothetical protein